MARIPSQSEMVSMVELALQERARRIAEIRTRAVELVVVEMLSTESLRAVEPAQPSEG